MKLPFYLFTLTQTPLDPRRRRLLIVGQVLRILLLACVHQILIKLGRFFAQIGGVNLPFVG